ncbi:MAG: hypothetical protein PHG03_02360 [Bacilli bacterium]|nr:hypothetical protein [Bacilli bacterium]MDD4795383.1 hypothetical protein [Bacilli bacterium]
MDIEKKINSLFNISPEVKLCKSNIKKYEMDKYQDMILNHIEIFNGICLVVENNNKLPSFVKKGVISTFPRLIQAKKFINFNNYLYKLSLLEYEEIGEINGIKSLNSYIFYDYEFNEISKTLIPKICYPSKSCIEKHPENLFFFDNINESIYHETEHFNGSKNNLSVDALIVFSNGRFSDISHQDQTCALSLNGRIFEEGLVSIFTRENGYPESDSYLEAQRITNLYTYIFGAGIMLESHHSEDKTAVLMNAVLDLGFTPEEVIDIFTRLKTFYNLTYDENNSKIINVNLDFLSYQIADDIINIYEKKQNKSFITDCLFNILLDDFIKVEDLNIENELRNTSYVLYSLELLRAINEKESFSNKFFPMEIKVAIELGFKIKFKTVNLNAFNSLDNLIRISVLLDNDYNNKITYQKIIINFEFKNNKLVFKDYIFENNQKVNNDLEYVLKPHNTGY